jgi:RND family efflux transporter MFP subunit
LTVGTASGNRIWGLLAAGTVLATVGLAGTAAYLTWGTPNAEAESAQDTQETESVLPLRVHVVHPEKGKMPRITRQPGNVLSFDSVGLHSEVTGYIKHQAVDIGAKVKRNQTLIEIDVPELEKQREKCIAVVSQKEACVRQAEARRKAAFADIKSADAKIVQARANANSAQSWLKFRKLQLDRTFRLVRDNALEEKLYEESMERHEAAVETLTAAKAAIETAKAEREAVDARVAQADADIEAAKADVAVAKAELERAKVLVDFATIRAPYDGYITTRSKLPGDFVKAGTETAAEPLLTVERTDKVRVVVQIPDRDVPYCDPSDKATVEIDALPGLKIPAEISRIARSEETHTKLMRVEIDVDNKDGKLRQGMYGWVTIVLDRSPEQLSIPTSCLVGKARDGSATVYVVREGMARLVPIKYGADNGSLVAVESGLTLRDEIISHAPTGLHEDMRVEIEK